MISSRCSLVAKSTIPALGGGSVFGNRSGTLADDSSMFDKITGWVVFSALALAVASCGKEVVRVPFSQAGSDVASVELKAGDVAFWTDLDLKHSGEAALEYRIELWQNGASVAAAICDPLGQMTVKIGWTEYNFGSSHSRSGEGKMSCRAHVAQGGTTEVRAALVVKRLPATMALSKADLIVKQ